MLLALYRRLIAQDEFRSLSFESLVPLPDSGLAHDHVRIMGRRLMARVPKQSQMALAAADNLNYQATCFQRASISGHTPRLQGVLPPGVDLPMGGLLVDAIDGRPPQLPQDLKAIAQALAAIHSLPLPPSRSRAPLRDHDDPVKETLAEVLAQAAYLDRAGLDPRARAAIQQELDWAEDFAWQNSCPPVTLISFDAHPGNFLIEPNGKAVLVDLEKARYGAPGFDLAHATLYTSTTWDVSTHAVLTAAEVAEFYASWLDVISPELAAASAPRLLPLRRVMWLWSTTWCAKWRVQSRAEAKAAKHALAETEDWSGELSNPVLVAHVAERVGHYLDPQTIDRIRGDWLGNHALTELLELTP